MAKTSHVGMAIQNVVGQNVSCVWRTVRQSDNRFTQLVSWVRSQQLDLWYCLDTRQLERVQMKLFEQTVMWKGGMECWIGTQRRPTSRSTILYVLVHLWLCVFGGRGLCVFGGLCVDVTIGTPMVIFAVLTVFRLFLVHCWYTVSTVLVGMWRLVHQWLFLLFVLSFDSKLHLPLDCPVTQTIQITL